jgi:hypothetical protein
LRHQGDGRLGEAAEGAAVSVVSRLAVKTHARRRGYITDYRPQAKTLALLNQVRAVLAEYRSYWPLTVRQVFYRLVGAYGHPKSEAFYARVCEHVANARRARVIPFAAIRDDGISFLQQTHFRDPDDFFGYTRQLGLAYRRDRLARQAIHVEVWCEASGMVPQLASVANVLSVPVYSSSGFDSLTAKKDLADRIARISKPTFILHLGDFDPSGESIFRAAAEDVRAFVLADRIDARADVEFRRVALTAAQVAAERLPTAPPKASDSRSRRWTGETCQLEALPPNRLADLLQQEIEGVLDPVLLQADADMEVLERRQIALALPTGRRES